MQLGYRETKEDDPTLNVVLDSLIQFIQENNTSIKLPIYSGKAVICSAKGLEANSSELHNEGSGKEYAWSRGLGIEHSPIKTQITQKKLVVLATNIVESTPSSTDCGPLRALKALAWAK